VKLTDKELEELHRKRLERVEKATLEAEATLRQRYPESRAWPRKKLIKLYVNEFLELFRGELIRGEGD
jgi:hypothetical protein